MITTTKENFTIISVDEILSKLEPLIRRVVREELKRVVQEESNIFYLKHDSPLYEDMEEIIQRKLEDKIELFTDQEVWNE